MSTNYRVSFVAGTEGLASSEICAKWREAISQSANFRVALQTPEWAAYRSGFAGRLTLCIMRTQEGGIVGVTPLLENSHSLGFSVGRKSLLNVPAKGLLLMGNLPLMPAEARESFFEALAAKTTCDSVHILGIPRGAEFDTFLQSLGTHRESPWLFYRLEPSQRYYYIQMLGSLEEYVKQFGSKARYNLKREAKLLKARGGGELELARITRPEQVGAFLQEARAIASKSWQKFLVGLALDESANRQELLTSMAIQGILRAYVLRCGGIPCAYGIGFQLNGIFYFYETAYDEEWSNVSPGKVMIYLLLQDLFAHEPPHTFYFGPGDAHYKRWFANASGDEVTWLVLRKTFSNRVKIAVHRGFRSLVERLKRFRPTTDNAMPLTSQDVGETSKHRSISKLSMLAVSYNLLLSVWVRRGSN